MAIPLISNVGFTEVSSSGSLNTKAGDKTKLPVQFFKLSDNISGNLSLDNNSAHKKIILDTNGNNITNSSGSPLTTNSSTTLELKGSGNVQSTLKTFTSSQSSTSNSGTTTISEADNSTVVVQTDTHEFDAALVDDNRSAGSGVTFGDGNTTVTKPNTGSTSAMLVNETYYTTGYAERKPKLKRGGTGFGSKVNLTLTGDMMNGLQTRGFTSDSVTIGWRFWVTRKIQWNEDMGRAVTTASKPLSNQSIKIVQQEARQRIKRNADKETAKPINFKIGR